MGQPKIGEKQLDIDWFPSMQSFVQLQSLTGMEDGDVVFVKDDDTFYAWDAPSSTWIIPAAYAKGFTSGCRLSWVSTSSVLVNKGSIEIKGKVCEKSSDLVLTWADLESGSTKGANKWYYVYLEKLSYVNWATGVSYTVGSKVQYAGSVYNCIQAHTSQASWTPDTAVTLWQFVSALGATSKEFKAFISDKSPTKDQFGNTIDSSVNVSKYHPTRDARFVGTFRTNSSQNIVQFVLNANYVAYIGQGSNYFMQNGNARTKTGVNCRTLVPVTSMVCSLYFQLNAGTNTRYIGDATSWYITATSGAGSIIMPITNDSIYYQCSGTNTVSLGIFGYYEEI